MVVQKKKKTTNILYRLLGRHSGHEVKNSTYSTAHHTSSVCERSRFQKKWFLKSSVANIQL